MRDVNRVILMGRLGANPEFRSTDGGYHFARLSLATENMKGETIWHRVVVWGKQAEVCTKYLVKGSTIYLEGRIDQYKVGEGVEAKTRYDVVAERVTFLGSRPRMTLEEDQEAATVQDSVLLPVSSNAQSFAEIEQTG